MSEPAPQGSSGDAVDRLLDVDRIYEMWQEKTLTLPGREAVQAVDPVDTLPEAARLQALTTEARLYLRHAGYPPIEGISDVRPSLQRAEKGSILSTTQLLATGAVARASRLTREYLLDSEIPAAAEAVSPVEMLPEWGEALTTFSDWEEHLDQTIDPDGRIKDHASPRLAKLRQRQRQLEEQIQERLRHLVQSDELQPYLQERWVTVRGDRYVVPVKKEHQSRIEGIVHDQSGSGMTVFIEPLAVVNLNNRLRQAQEDEREEMRQIRQELSQTVAGMSSDLQMNLEQLIYLDLVIGRARLAEAWSSSPPDLNADGIVDLKQARHPLLDSDTVIPVDIQLGQEFDALVITGPNTGGKTVSLKTVGLFARLVQLGFHLPVDHGSKMAFFQRVHCDIGDEQSIEQNLSTFSSHMSRIIDIVETARPGDLVLLDEIGAGTDPADGSALAMALLDHFHQQGMYTVVTTHYRQLKKYAYDRDRVANASVAFDRETLEPAYELVIGLPGRSNALDIAKRLGLRRDILQTAERFLSDDAVDFDHLMTEIQKDRQTLREERQAVEAQRARMEDERAEARAELAGFRRQAEDLMAKLRTKIQELEAFEPEETSESERTSKPGAVREGYRLIEKVRSEFRDLETPLRNEPSSEEAPEVEEGDWVQVRSLQQTGTVLNASDPGAVVVQVGMMKVTVSQNDLKLAAAETKPKQRTDRGRRLRRQKVGQTEPEIHLRHLSRDQALHRLDKYLDDAFLAGYREVRIIHGKGEGILRRTVHQYLDDHPQVARYHMASRHEGGAGVTVVRFQTSS